MNQDERLVIKFVDFIAKMEDILWNYKKLVQEIPVLENVSTQISAIKQSGTPGYISGGELISISLDADLKKPIGEYKRSIGIQLLLRRTDKIWTIECEVGWVSAAIGWDNFLSRETEVASIEEFIQHAPASMEWLIARFREEVAKLSPR